MGPADCDLAGNRLVRPLELFGGHSADAVRTAGKLARGLFAHRAVLVGVLKPSSLQAGRELDPRHIHAAGLESRR